MSDIMNELEDSIKKMLEKMEKEEGGAKQDEGATKNTENTENKTGITQSNEVKDKEAINENIIQGKETGVDKNRKELEDLISSVALKTYLSAYLYQVLRNEVPDVVGNFKAVNEVANSLKEQGKFTDDVLGNISLLVQEVKNKFSKTSKLSNAPKNTKIEGAISGSSNVGKEESEEEKLVKGIQSGEYLDSYVKGNL
ncbi:MAG: hypothetical protein QW416_09335 [Candidatus Nitrosocaldaceae archaeon]